MPNVTADPQNGSFQVFPGIPPFPSRASFPPTDDRRRLSEARRRCAGVCSQVCQHTISQTQKRLPRLLRATLFTPRSKEPPPVPARRGVSGFSRPGWTTEDKRAESCSSQFTFGLTWDGCSRGYDCDQTPTLPVPPSCKYYRLHSKAF